MVFHKIKFRKYWIKQISLQQNFQQVPFPTDIYFYHQNLFLRPREGSLETTVP